MKKEVNCKDCGNKWELMLSDDESIGKNMEVNSSIGVSPFKPHEVVLYKENLGAIRVITCQVCGNTWNLDTVNKADPSVV